MESIHKKPRKGILSFFLLIVFAVGSCLGFYIRDNYSTITPVVKADTLVSEKIRQAELTIVQLDLKEYTFLSTDMKDNMARAIDTASKTYRIPVGLLHAILRIESGYQFQIDHPTVTIRVHGKLIKTHARGCGGIIWEIWADTLVAHGIATAPSDLYVPEKNILATACILRITTNQALSEKPTSSSVIREVIRRYFGAYSPAYEARMSQVMTDLWLKRISRDLLTE